MNKIIKTSVLVTIIATTPTTMLPTIRLKSCSDQPGGRPLNSHKVNRLLNRKIERENRKILEQEERKFWKKNKQEDFSEVSGPITCDEIASVVASAFLVGVIGWLLNS